MTTWDAFDKRLREKRRGIVEGFLEFLRHNTVSQNPAGAGMSVTQTSNEADAADTMFTNNAIGIFAGLAGGGPVVRLTRCTITGNTTSGVTINPPASITGFSTNLVAGNAGTNAISTTASQ